MTNSETLHKERFSALKELRKALVSWEPLMQRSTGASKVDVSPVREGVFLVTFQWSSGGKIVKRFTLQDVGPGTRASPDRWEPCFYRKAAIAEALKHKGVL